MSTRMDTLTLVKSITGYYDVHFWCFKCWKGYENAGRSHHVNMAASVVVQMSSVMPAMQMFPVASVTWFSLVSNASYNHQPFCTKAEKVCQV